MRTDIHRKSEIKPENYEYILSYSLATTFDGWEVPSQNINCEKKHSEDGTCCIVALRNIAKVNFALHGSTGKCTVCGTRYIYGEIWKHIETGEHIHVGHICAGKYGMVSEIANSKYKKLKGLKAYEIEKIRKNIEKEEILSKHQGLKEAFECDHYIVQDIKSRFDRYCNISAKQIDLVFKLFNESKNKAEEKHVKAPQGRVEFEGVVLCTKTSHTNFGLNTRMTIKVETEEGVWLANGTVPGNLLGQGLKGKVVRLKATLSRTRDEHFAFFKRPAGAKIISE
jgi:hypothetical protein